MRISVIIPTYNEGTVIAATLANVARQRPHEIIVVDGGSTDDTCERAPVMTAPAGRASQMNYGAARASGDMLLFLHADTGLPDGALRAIQACGARGGRFRARFDDPHWLMQVYGWFTRFHALSFGDQGYFVSRDLFWSIGGYRTDVPFEDMDFYARLRRRTRPAILPLAVVTSARRFEENGRVRQQLINVLLVAWHRLGGDVRWLKSRLYGPIR